MPPNNDFDFSNGSTSILSEKPTLLKDKLRQCTGKQRDSGVSSGHLSDHMKRFLKDVSFHSKHKSSSFHSIFSDGNLKRIIIHANGNPRVIGEQLQKLGDNHVKLANHIRNYHPAPSTAKVEEKRAAPDGHVLSEDNYDHRIELITDEFKKSRSFMKSRGSHHLKDHVSHKCPCSCHSRPKSYYHTACQCQCRERPPHDNLICPDDADIISSLKRMQEIVFYGTHLSAKNHKTDRLSKSD